MIKSDSIRHRGLLDLYQSGRSRRVQQALAKRVKQRMDVLDSMENVTETAAAFPSLGLHQLTGTRSGTWSMKVNGPWRLTFRFVDGNVEDLDLEQYH